MCVGAEKHMHHDATESRFRRRRRWDTSGTGGAARATGG
jgi:hypothetical protein